MTEKEKAAYKIIDDVCANYLGTRKEHVILQESLKILNTALNPKTEDTVKVNLPEVPVDLSKENEEA